MSTPAGSAPRPPFDADTARRLREALALTPAQVAYGMWAAYGLRVSPGTVAAWEDCQSAPTEAELNALAGALWCAPGDLMGTPRTLREFRLARGLASRDVALRLGMRPADYERLEAEGRWTGTPRQAVLLGEALRLPLPALVDLTGRGERLAELLRGAATTRWQAYVGPVRAIVPLPKDRVREALDHLNEEYHRLMAASANWGEGGSAQASGQAGREFLDSVRRHFWERLGKSAT